MNRFSKLWIVALMLTPGCIEEIDIALPKDSVLIIEGLITNQPAAHKVQISHSYAFNDNPIFTPINPIVLGAHVQIFDDENNSTTLTEGKYGSYYTPPNFTGVVGRSYTLKVTLTNGMTYVSKEEKLLPNGAEINNVCYENTFKEFSRNGSIIREKEITFKVTYTDNPETADYYRWGYKGVYQVEAPLSDNPPGCNPTCGPCPVIPMKTCWATSFDVEFLKIDRDLHFNGKTIEDYIIYSTSPDRKFNIGYAANIEQYSLTESAYEYWNAISKQLNNNGTVFETPNHQIRGNIMAEDDPEQLVLGYFGASAKTVSRVILSDADVPGNLGPVDCNRACIPFLCIDCRKWPATNVKPDYWPW